jgi:hypothetical protein
VQTDCICWWHSTLPRNLAGFFQYKFSLDTLQWIYYTFSTFSNLSPALWTQWHLMLTLPPILLNEIRAILWQCLCFLIFPISIYSPSWFILILYIFLLFTGLSFLLERIHLLLCHPFSLTLWKIFCIWLCWISSMSSCSPSLESHSHNYLILRNIWPMSPTVFLLEPQMSFWIVLLIWAILISFSPYIDCIKKGGSLCHFHTCIGCTLIICTPPWLFLIPCSPYPLPCPYSLPLLACHFPSLDFTYEKKHVIPFFVRLANFT